MNEKNTTEWLLLIHQIPPKPDYFRVKIWRRLQKIGAVAVKQSVYVLPSNKQAYEDMHWTIAEIVEGGGTASLSKAVFCEGLSNTQIESLFQVARDGEYEKIIKDAQAFLEESNDSATRSGSLLLKKKKELSRIQRRFTELVSIDFFNAPRREEAERVLIECEVLLRDTKSSVASMEKGSEKMQKQTWVTRKGINVDRIACAWLIQRFIDPKGTLKFVEDEQYQTLSDEVRFDMFEGEFTHIGDNCSFEVLVNAFGLASQEISAIAEIVHDIDLKDGKFNRPESLGIQAVFSGIVRTSSNDNDRLKRGSMILDELYASFGGSRKN